MKLQKELAYRANEVDRIIVNYLPKTGQEYQNTVFEAMNYSVLAGGKRLRPILMNETYKLFGGKMRAIEPFMAAIEMIHTYSLVHDDLPAMDNDVLRRGRPTTHAKYGEAMGILAGDALLNYAFETALLALEADPASPAVAKALSILAGKAGVYGMIGGQVIDVEAEKQYGISRNRLDAIYRLKTGALIEAAMTIGAILGGATVQEVDIIEKIAGEIGLAFQIQDDILDVVGNEEVLGKTVGSDAKNRKATYVSFQGLDKSRAEVRRLTDEALEQLHELTYENRFLTELLGYLVYRES